MIKLDLFKKGKFMSLFYVIFNQVCCVKYEDFAKKIRGNKLPYLEDCKSCLDIFVVSLLPNSVATELTVFGEIHFS